MFDCVGWELTSNDLKGSCARCCITKAQGQQRDVALSQAIRRNVNGVAFAVRRTYSGCRLDRETPAETFVNTEGHANCTSAELGTAVKLQFR